MTIIQTCVRKDLLLTLQDVQKAQKFSSISSEANYISCEEQNFPPYFEEKGRNKEKGENLSNGWLNQLIERVCKLRGLPKHLKCHLVQFKATRNKFAWQINLCKGTNLSVFENLWIYRFSKWYKQRKAIGKENNWVEGELIQVCWRFICIGSEVAKTVLKKTASVVNFTTRTEICNWEE